MSAQSQCLKSGASRQSAIRSRGFTLVELLVVIGIIALLISILLPSLNRARKQAQTLKCLSALRQIGMGFQFYQGEYKGALPCVRMDFPDDASTGYLPQNTGYNTATGIGGNWYWSDMIIKYVSKNGKMGFSYGATNTVKDFETARKSVMWGCPDWEGWPEVLSGGISAGNFISGLTRYENGYSMNYWPTITAGYPANGADLPPATESQIRSQVISVGAGPGAGPAVGQYFKITDWRQAAEKMLVCDANLWLLGFEPVATAGNPIAPQNAQRAHASAVGSNNIDRYRHGAYPKLRDINTFSDQGGRVAFNVLYADGHAATLTNIREGYKAIRMRYP